MAATVLDPADIYERGLRDPEGLTSAERLVFILMDLETLMDMEGWDHFFTSKSARYYPELKQGLVALGDTDSLEVLEDYERHLSERNVPFHPSAIEDFLGAQDEKYLNHCRDWREDYSRLSERRWRKLREHLGTLGFALQA